ncbi:hypothetical protein tb265_07620 [Gemmatimonadetes bacterium T265]|nr:hypothetical protein tb265_07620 [Gemmatimonadetes bacterium T265]
MAARFARRAARAAVVAAAATCDASHYVAPPTTAPRNLVSATPSLRFAPAEITVAVGDSVTWAFAGVTHTVIFQRPGDARPAGAPADVGPTSDASVTRVFTTRGTFGYGCRLHPGMGGLVHVR